MINLSLKSMKDEYLAATVKLEAENHYRSRPNNGSSQFLLSVVLVPGVEFLHHNTAAGFPPNTFVIVDTHSDEFTRMLQHTGGHTGSTSTSIREILMAYLGEEYMNASKEASITARMDWTFRKTVNGKEPWSNVMASCRGGWRGVFMVSCGPAIRVSHHFEEVRAMVQNTIRSLLLEIGVFGETNVWTALCNVLASSNDLLDYTTAVLVYSTISNREHVIECWQISKDIPGVHIHYLKCKWRSASVSTNQDNQHFKKIDKTNAPNLFWHYYPTSSSLQNFFVEQTIRKKDNEAAALHQKGRGKKGVDKKGKGKQREVSANIKEDSEMSFTGPDDRLNMDMDE
ncbi:hypothetical protein BDR06DRAFT_967416 [Suillus hirtellus]|nr:hypothetical protein BDR06DRAFT_967416 [Suillus hirtellus]